MSLSPVSSRDSDFQPGISQNLYGPRSLSQGGPYPPEEQKQLRRMFRKHGIVAVPHGFRSNFRDWAAEERIIGYRRWSYIVVTIDGNAGGMSSDPEQPEHSLSNSPLTASAHPSWAIFASRALRRFFIAYRLWRFQIPWTPAGDFLIPRILRSFGVRNWPRAGLPIAEVTTASLPNVRSPTRSGRSRRGLVWPGGRAARSGCLRTSRTSWRALVYSEASPQSWMLTSHVLLQPSSPSQRRAPPAGYPGLALVSPLVAVSPVLHIISLIDTFTA